MLTVSPLALLLLVRGAAGEVSPADSAALVRVLFGAASTNSRRVLYAHTINRFEDLDLEFFSALERAGLRAERVWAAPDRPPTPEEPFAELFPQQWVGIYAIGLAADATS